MTTVGRPGSPLGLQAASPTLAEQPRFGRTGKQTIADTGPLTQERMKNFDAAEVIPLSEAFMASAKEAGEPFNPWPVPRGSPAGRPACRRRPWGTPG